MRSTASLDSFEFSTAISKRRVQLGTGLRPLIELNARNLPPATRSIVSALSVK
jgi:hypothetical protein